MGLFDAIYKMISNDVAIDLGTANTLVYVKNKGIVCNEPSVVTINEITKEPIAFGLEAKKMLERTPENIRTIRPLKDGVIADFEYTEHMLKYFIRKATNSSFRYSRPVIVICVPANVTTVEQRAVKDSAYQAGARDVYLISEPMAAAIGTGLPIHEPAGNMVVDIGGGTTEIAVISLYGSVYSSSIKVGGDEIDNSIVKYIKDKYHLAIGTPTAERIKMAIGSALPLSEKLTEEVKGRDIVNGTPRTIIIDSDEICEAIQDSVAKIVEGVRSALEKISPELSADISSNGVVMTGGGTLLRNLDAVISSSTGLPVIVTEDPLYAVINGVGSALDNPELLKKVSLH